MLCPGGFLAFREGYEEGDFGEWGAGVISFMMCGASYLRIDILFSVNEKKYGRLVAVDAISSASYEACGVCPVKVDKPTVRSGTLISAS